MNFTKMHGCGNDYIYINGWEYQPSNKEALAIAMSDRHFGVGGDGIIFINPSTIADFEMEMYNADGSRAEMCGNGIRCVGKYVYDHGMTDQTLITVESYGQVKTLELTVSEQKVKMVRVNMGVPIVEAKKIPVIAQGETVQDETIVVAGQEYKMTCVSMGNPHAVVFVPEVATLDLSCIGPQFEHHERFPKRTNTEFVKIISPIEIEMRVWERGSGETLACGTGCCASVVAAHLCGLTDREVVVHVLGGDIKVQWTEEGTVYMTGPAETVFDGCYQGGE